MLGAEIIEHLKHMELLKVVLRCFLLALFNLV